MVEGHLGLRGGAAAPHRAVGVLRAGVALPLRLRLALLLHRALLVHLRRPLGHVLVLAVHPVLELVRVAVLQELVLDVELVLHQAFVEQGRRERGGGDGLQAALLLPELRVRG